MDLLQYIFYDCVYVFGLVSYSVLETLHTLILLSVYPENKVDPSEDQAKEVQYGV